jgi:phthalate 4,5-dioxygenase reductase subunit
MKLRISRKQLLTADTVLFELASPSGDELPRFSAGAHLTVVLPNEARRNYSLCGDTEDRGRYQIAVKRQANGRGGSISLVNDTNVDDELEVSEPNNTFKLTSVATEYIFVAGGIGITPILSMVRYVGRRPELRWKLYYCTKSADHTAFREELHRLQAANGSTIYHHSTGPLVNRFEPWPVFEKPKKNCHIYCCGPISLMESIKDVTGHWPHGSAHFENFGIEKPSVENRPFFVRLKSTGARYAVPTDKSIIEVLRANGLSIPSSCESGTCGTCRTRLTAGVADHRDMVLQGNEKDSYVIPCVSRAISDELEIDL